MEEEDAHEAIDLRKEWRGMQRRIVDLIKSKDNKCDFADDLFQLDPSVYTDPERLEAERRKIFMQEPMLVALSSELAEPGDRVLFDAAGPPILVIRGSDGALRAFLNMCTHRGAKLVTSCDRTKGLLCPFHYWSFDLEGRLSGVPHERAFEGIDKEARGLVRVPIAEWNGMVFVRARPGEEELDIEGFLGPIGPLLTALELGSLGRIRADRLDVKANWKLALDMGRETYHVPAVHKNSIATNLYPHVAISDCYGPHSRFSGASLDFADFVEKPEHEWPEMNYQAVHYIFPNTTLTFTHSFDGKTPVVTISRIFPGESVGEAMTLMATYRRREAEGIADEQIVALHEAVLGIVGTEDYDVAHGVWQTIEHGSPGIDFVLGRNEPLVQRYHREVADRIGMPLPG